MESVSLRTEKVLVLNKLWQPISYIPAYRALRMLFGYAVDAQGKEMPKAKVIDTQDFNQYNWEDWTKLFPDKDEPFIAGVSRVFRVPKVILLTSYSKMHKRSSNFSRRAIYKRDNFQCQYCSDKPGIEELSIDHVLATSRGGKNIFSNVVLACVKCNSQKGDRLLEDCKKENWPKEKRHLWHGPSPMRLLSVPKKPEPGLLKGDRVSVPKDLEAFISEAFWNVELRD